MHQQHCWCTQQLCEWAKLSLFKKHEYLRTEESSFVVVIFNCRKLQKKVLSQFKITTAGEPSSVDSCGRTSSARSRTEEGSSAVAIFNCRKTFFRELICFFIFKFLNYFVFAYVILYFIFYYYKI